MARIKMEPLVSVPGSEALLVSADSVTSECVPSQGRRESSWGAKVLQRVKNCTEEAWGS